MKARILLAATLSGEGVQSGFAGLSVMVYLTLEWVMEGEGAAFAIATSLDRFPGGRKEPASS